MEQRGSRPREGVNFISSPGLSPGSSCVPWGSKERSRTSEWNHTLLQELLLKKLLRRSFLLEGDGTEPSGVQQRRPKDHSPGREVWLLGAGIRAEGIEL